MAHIVWIDTEKKLHARRATLRAMTAGRLGPRHKKKTGDDFDACIQASSRGRKDWTTATDEDVFDWCCVLDSQRNGATWVHDSFCPRAGITHEDACPPGGDYTKRLSLIHI